MSLLLKGRSGWVIRVLLFWMVSGLLAMGLDGGLISGSDASECITQQLFGSARSLIGNRMIIEADRYYHQGVGHTTERVTLSKVMTKWGDAIAPKQHTVLGRSDLEEIMPWFRFATKVDPQNVDAYVTAAYWCVRNGHPERAKKVLDEALEKNPDDFEILLAMGHAFRQTGMSAAAEDAYEQALEVWSSGRDSDEREMRVQLMELLLSLGSLCEERGDIDGAVAHYTSLQDRFPDHSSIGERISALQQGEKLAGVNFWDHKGQAGLCSHDHEEHEACDHNQPEQDHQEHPRSAAANLLAQGDHVCVDGCAHQH